MKCRRCNGRLWGRDRYCFPCGLEHLDVIPLPRGYGFSCAFCDMAFETAQTRSRHENAVHVDAQLRMAIG